MKSLLISKLSTICLSVVLSAMFFQTMSGSSYAATRSVKFQRPGASTVDSSQQKFRRPNESTADEVSQTTTQRANTVQQKRVAAVEATAKPLKSQKSVKKVVKAKKVVRKSAPVKQAVTEQYRNESESQVVRATSQRSSEEDLSGTFELMSHDCPHCKGGGSTYEVGYGMGGCDCGYGPSCGCPEPSCGIIEPGCGCAEPVCGVPGCGDGVSCGSCVGLPGPDYWCFPVCLPRFKDLSVWAGVQGFRGPRDFVPAGQSNSNFGFNEGFNLSGRAPLIGLVFPQLSYQLGYRAVQSRLHGTLSTAEERSQQFFTGGFFRRVHTGLQFGAVFDLMDDNLDTDIDLHQVRYEISLKSPKGREIGFWSTSGTNSQLSDGVVWEAVNQYAVFYRCNFGKSYEARFWGGGSDDSEGLFGAEFFAPLSDRWSLQSGFNYLITDQQNGPAGVQEESWNIGVNLVWHLGRNARRGCRSPYRPLFSVADNGWMFTDRQ